MWAHIQICMNLGQHLTAISISHQQTDQSTLFEEIVLVIQQSAKIEILNEKVKDFLIINSEPFECH